MSPGPQTTDQTAAFAAIYCHHKDEMITVAFHLLGDVALAEDALHDVFVALARAGTQLASIASMRAYLLQSCVHRARDLQRRRRRQEPDGVPIEQRECSEASPAESAERGDEDRRMRSLLEGLPVEQREVVTLRLFCDLSFREIAELLDVPQNTVQSRHRYALSTLRQRVSQRTRT